MTSNSARSPRSRALRVRDAGLRRISAVTRVVVVGSIAAAGMFTALAAWAQPGRAKTIVRTGSTGAATGRFSGGTNPGTNPGTTAGTTPGTNSVSATTPTTAPTTDPATVAPSDGGYSSGYSISPPATLPDPGYQYSGPAVVSGAS